MRRCPNCESGIPIRDAAQAIRSGQPIRCRHCGYFLKLARSTRVCSFVSGGAMFAIAIVNTVFVFTFFGGLPSWLGFPVFIVSFFAAFQLCSAAVGFIAKFAHAVAPHHCRHCHYDLRSTTTTICPECGEAFVPVAGDAVN